jgi:enamine deaminase RidA (YjgF/YER057c/UK114 family)
MRPHLGQVGQRSTPLGVEGCAKWRLGVPEGSSGDHSMNGAKFWHHFSLGNATHDHKGRQSMQRTAINPWDWSLRLGYNQAEIIEGASRQLICAGQTAVDATGQPQHLGDMRGQIGLALDNLEAVLAEAGMGLQNVIRLGIFTTDVDAALQNFDLLGMRFGPLRCAPPMTLLGVSQLAIPTLMFEIEATAAA